MRTTARRLTAAALAAGVLTLAAPAAPALADRPHPDLEEEYTGPQGTGRTASAATSLCSAPRIIGLNCTSLRLVRVIAGWW